MAARALSPKAFATVPTLVTCRTSAVSLFLCLQIFEYKKENIQKEVFGPFRK